MMYVLLLEVAEPGAARLEPGADRTRSMLALAGNGVSVSPSRLSAVLLLIVVVVVVAAPAGGPKIEVRVGVELPVAGVEGAAIVK